MSERPLASRDSSGATIRYESGLGELSRPKPTWDFARNRPVSKFRAALVLEGQL